MSLENTVQYTPDNARHETKKLPDGQTLFIDNGQLTLLERGKPICRFTFGEKGWEATLSQLRFAMVRDDEMTADDEASMGRALDIVKQNYPDGQIG